MAGGAVFVQQAGAAHQILQLGRQAVSLIQKVGRWVGQTGNLRCLDTRIHVGQLRRRGVGRIQHIGHALFGIAFQRRHSLGQSANSHHHLFGGTYQRLLKSNVLGIAGQRPRCIKK